MSAIAVNRTDEIDEKELKRLNREQLLRIMLSQSREIDRLKESLSLVQGQIAGREQRLSGAADLASACAALNRLEDAARGTAEQYLGNILRICAEKAADAGKRAAWEEALKEVLG